MKLIALGKCSHGYLILILMQKKKVPLQFSMKLYSVLLYIISEPKLHAAPDLQVCASRVLYRQRRSQMSGSKGELSKWPPVRDIMYLKYYNVLLNFLLLISFL